MNSHTTVNHDTSSPLRGENVQTLSERVAQVCRELEERKHLIEAALKHARGTHTYDDIVAMVLTDRLRWWCLPNSFMVTEVCEFPQTKLLHVFLGGGDLTEIIDMHPTMIAHAKEMGCSRITMSGRIGWKPVLMKHGWGKPSLGIELEIPKDG